MERLELPDYPQLPLAARIQGIQTIKVLLSQEATVQAVESSLETRSKGVEKYFKESVEKALRISRFSKACSGKTVTMVFHYELREDDKKSLFAFQPPNHFLVRAGPFYVMPEGSRK